MADTSCEWERADPLQGKKMRKVVPACHTGEVESQRPAEGGRLNRNGEQPSV